MGAALNGITLQSLTRPYGGTFRCFPTTCARPSAFFFPRPPKTTTTAAYSRRPVPTGAAVAAKPGLPPSSALAGKARLSLRWAAGDTVGRRRHLGKEPAALPGRRPSVCRPGVLGQFFECAAALAFPEDRYQGAGEECARDRDP
jgi:hypothetical protein